MSISEEEAIRSGLDPGNIRLPEEYGGGFMATVEYVNDGLLRTSDNDLWTRVNHQLHCVNLVRKATYFDYYQNRTVEFTDKSDTIRQHLGEFSPYKFSECTKRIEDHCIDMIRQIVMCNADVGLVGAVWVEGAPGPYPNFNTWHQCRNFDNILQWTYDHALTVNLEPESWPILPGSKVFKEAP